ASYICRCSDGLFPCRDQDPPMAKRKIMPIDHSRSIRLLQDLVGSH
ncbi:uncharacterized protein METZ01_LOCUS401687, partial [marine metagenome]